MTKHSALCAALGLVVFGGTNAPDTYSADATFSSTPVLADNGAVSPSGNRKSPRPAAANGAYSTCRSSTAAHWRITSMAIGTLP